MKKRHTNKGFAAVTFCTLLFAIAATSVQAQDLFIPAKDADWIDDDPFLQQTVFEGSNCYYFCDPALSWHKKYALSLHDSTLVYVRVLRDDWKSWLLTGFWKPKTLRYEMSLRQTEQRAILDLLEAATQTAKPRNMDIGIDGATCYLCHNARKVEVHSPFGGTLTTLTVNALDSLCYATEHSDRAVLLRQIETCRTLTEEFRKFYPYSAALTEPAPFGQIITYGNDTIALTSANASWNLQTQIGDSWCYQLQLDPPVIHITLSSEVSNRLNGKIIRQFELQRAYGTVVYHDFQKKSDREYQMREVKGGFYMLLQQ